MKLGLGMGLTDRQYPSGGAPPPPPTVYDSWATIGNPYASNGYVYLAPLFGQYIAEYNAVTDKLTTLYWDGTDFTQFGNKASFALGNTVGLAKLTSSLVVTLDGSAELMQAHLFTGTDWIPVGAPYSLTMGGYPSGDYLEDNAIAVWDNSGGLAKYTFNGSGFTKVGNTLSGTANYSAVASLSPSRVVTHNTNTEKITAFDFDGTDWAQVGNALSVTAVAGTFQLVGMSETQLVYFSNTSSQVQTLSFDGTDFTTEGSASNLTGLASWPRSMVKMSDTLIAYHSYGDADIRAAEATLA